MELSGSSYHDIMKMPVKRLEEFIQWKIKFDSDREKAKSESNNKLKI